MLDVYVRSARRVAVWAAAFATNVALTVACSSGSGFACASDSDCALAGEAGVCVSDTSQCAYPDDRCDSGFSYPSGAGAELGGVCADGEFDVGTTSGGPTSVTVSTTSPPATTNVDDATTTTGPSDSTSSDGGVVGSTGLGSTSGPAMTDGTTTDDPTVGAESSSGDPPPPQCPADPSEANNSIMTATDLMLADGDCATMQSGVLDPLDDQDWYLVGGGACWLDGATIEMMAPAGTEICAVYDGCVGNEGIICPVGATAPPGNLDGCCDVGPFAFGAACNNGALYVLVHDAPQMCVEYTFGIAAL